MDSVVPSIGINPTKTQFSLNQPRPVDDTAARRVNEKYGMAASFQSLAKMSEAIAVKWQEAHALDEFNKTKVAIDQIAGEYKQNAVTGSPDELQSYFKRVDKEIGKLQETLGMMDFRATESIRKSASNYIYDTKANFLSQQAAKTHQYELDSATANVTMLMQDGATIAGMPNGINTQEFHDNMLRAEGGIKDLLKKQGLQEGTDLFTLKAQEMKAAHLYAIGLHMIEEGNVRGSRERYKRSIDNHDLDTDTDTNWHRAIRLYLEAEERKRLAKAASNKSVELNYQLYSGYRAPQLAADREAYNAAEDQRVEEGKKLTKKSLEDFFRDNEAVLRKLPPALVSGLTDGSEESIQQMLDWCESNSYDPVVVADTTNLSALYTKGLRGNTDTEQMSAIMSSAAIGGINASTNIVGAQRVLDNSNREKLERSEQEARAQMHGKITAAEAEQLRLAAAQIVRAPAPARYRTEATDQVQISNEWMDIERKQKLYTDAGARNSVVIQAALDEYKSRLSKGQLLTFNELPVEEQIRMALPDPQTAQLQIEHFNSLPEAQRKAFINLNSNSGGKGYNLKATTSLLRMLSKDQRLYYEANPEEFTEYLFDQNVNKDLIDTDAAYGALVELNRNSESRGQDDAISAALRAASSRIDEMITKANVAHDNKSLYKNAILEELYNDGTLDELEQYAREGYEQHRDTRGLLLDPRINQRFEQAVTDAITRTKERIQGLRD